MAMGFSLRAGLILPAIGIIHPKLHFPIHYKWSSFNGTRVASGMIRNGRMQHCLAKEYSLCVRRNHHHLTVNDDFNQEPFWLNLLKEALWAVKSLLAFLAEQPSQLKYIEWPSFQSTLRTSTLTLLLVGMLIISLSSLDSVLCYLLSFLLRRRT